MSRPFMLEDDSIHGGNDYHHSQAAAASSGHASNAAINNLASLLGNGSLADSPTFAPGMSRSDEYISPIGRHPSKFAAPPGPIGGLVMAAGSYNGNGVSGMSMSAFRNPPPNPSDQNPPCNTLYVGNLPMNTSEEELRALFSRCFGYKRMCFRTKANGPMCFVEFEDIACATHALNELYGNPLSNSVKGGIRLSYSKNPLGVRQNTTDQHRMQLAQAHQLQQQHQQQQQQQHLHHY